MQKIIVHCKQRSNVYGIMEALDGEELCICLILGNCCWVNTKNSWKWSWDFIWFALISVQCTWFDGSYPRIHFSLFLV
jgi:hypothetical protein